VEGFDRIPQRVLKDGCDRLFRPLTVLFKKYIILKVDSRSMASEQNNLSIQKKGMCQKLKIIDQSQISVH
jgi:hypothetical protein